MAKIPFFQKTVTPPLDLRIWKPRISAYIIPARGKNVNSFAPKSDTFLSVHNLLTGGVTRRTP
jgi:hypothetical protein